jgi:hypothetical protein
VLVLGCSMSGVRTNSWHNINTISLSQTIMNGQQRCAGIQASLTNYTNVKWSAMQTETAEKVMMEILTLAVGVRGGMVRVRRQACQQGCRNLFPRALSLSATLVMLGIRGEAILLRLLGYPLSIPLRPRSVLRRRVRSGND